MAQAARIGGRVPLLTPPSTESNVGLPRVGPRRPIFVAALALSASAPCAHAHSWYDAACCSGRDCAPISVDAVGFDSNGDYVVTIEAGTHPLVEQTQTWVWPRTDARMSRDGSWHGCVSLLKDAAGHQRLLCLYAPMSF